MVGLLIFIIVFFNNNIVNSVPETLWNILQLRFRSNNLLDILTDSYTVCPTDEQALRIEVPMFTLQKLLHLMPKWHAKLFKTPFIISSVANLGVNQEGWLFWMIYLQKGNHYLINYSLKKKHIQNI